MWLAGILEFLWQYGSEVFPLTSVMLTYLLYEEYKEYQWQLERRRLLAELLSEEKVV
jgi:hypothetical protein